MYAPPPCELGSRIEKIVLVNTIHVHLLHINVTNGIMTFMIILYLRKQTCMEPLYVSVGVSHFIRESVSQLSVNHIGNCLPGANIDNSLHDVPWENTNICNKDNTESIGNISIDAVFTI